MASIRKATAPTQNAKEYDSPFIEGSVFDTVAETGPYSQTSPYSASDLVNNPSPAWMDKAADYALRGTLGIVSTAAPEIGIPMSYLVGQTMKSGNNTWTLGEALTDAAKAALGGVASSTNLVGKGVGSLGMENDYANAAAGFAGKIGLSSLISGFTDWASGKLGLDTLSTIGWKRAGQEDTWAEANKGTMGINDWANITGVPANTLAASSKFGGGSYANEDAPGGFNNPSLTDFPDSGGYALGPTDTANYRNSGGGSTNDVYNDTTNMLGDPNNDPYGAVPDIGGGEQSGPWGGPWGGPDGGWTGEAWGDSWL
jgi:hypothetical protein